MRVNAARFLVSATGPTDGAGWPADGPPEIAFVGRSNVGKSTLLGALLGRRGLVRTSNAPGRTRLLNFFDAEIVEDGGAPPRPIRFVDLPGFGYAKASKEERAKLRPIVQRYLVDRRSLRAIALLVDLRRGAELDETELAAFARDHGRALLIVGTKADKLSKHERKPALERLARAMGAPVMAVAAEQGEGVEALLRRLHVALFGPGA